MREKNETKIQTILGKDTIIDGDFQAIGSTRVDGSIKGNVTIKGTLILGATGQIFGDVEAKSAVVGGEIIGHVITTDRVDLCASAKVIGDIKTNAFTVDTNAVFQGRCDMNLNEEELKKSSRGNKVSMKDARENKKSAKAAIEEALKEVEAMDTQNDSANSNENE